MRAILVQDPPEHERNEDLEVEWITRYLELKRAGEKWFLVEMAGIPVSDVDKLLEWTRRSAWETLQRQAVRSVRDDVEEAGRILNKLVSIFNRRPTFFWQKATRPGGEITRDLEVNKAFHILRQAIESQLVPEAEITNFGTNRSNYILIIWPALDQLNYSMRAASRIIARAFEACGLEGGEDEKRQESIYQAIRNAGR